jgi:hypothetical protein
MTRTMRSTDMSLKKVLVLMKMALKRIVELAPVTKRRPIPVKMKKPA